MREIEIHEKLRHLTMLQIESLMNKYYNGVKASDIIKEYNICESIVEILIKKETLQ